MTIRRLFLVAVLSAPLLPAISRADQATDAFLNEGRSLVMNTQAIRVAVQKRLSQGNDSHAKAPDEGKAPSATRH